MFCFKPTFIPPIILHTLHTSTMNSAFEKQWNAAADRNKEPILKTLKLYIENRKGAKLLEVSSGSGQHVAFLAPHFPNVTFLPTELDKKSLESIKRYVAESGAQNIKDAQVLDVRQPAAQWLGGSIPPASLDYLLNINMMHISEWACTRGLFEGSGILLKEGGMLLSYGPYAQNGRIEPDSNIQFDASLRHRNEAWGLRDIHLELVPVARTHAIQLKNIHSLPANNKLLVWQKDKNTPNP